MHALMVTFSVSLALMGQADTQKPAAAKDQETEFAREQKKKWDAFYQAEAASYLILQGGDPAKPLTLRREPVLFWTNPVRRGDTNGAVFVWTRDGRAEVVGTVFSHLTRDLPARRHIAHSFHSLSLQPLVAERDKEEAWTIEVPGIKFQPIPNAPAPAATAAARLTQMRDIAREFSAVTVLEGEEQELRLLPQPLYRNEKASDDVADGALFTFVTGTDPELMLVIEARGKTPAWQFAAGRFTDLSLKLRHKDNVLWTYQEGLVDNSQTPYLSRRVSLQDVILP